MTMFWEGMLNLPLLAYETILITSLRPIAQFSKGVIE